MTQAKTAKSRAASHPGPRPIPNPAEAASVTAQSFGFTAWNRIASTKVKGRPLSSPRPARPACAVRQARYRIQPAATTWSVSFSSGAASSAAPTPSAAAAARIPVPTGTPSRCGIVARKPKRAPEAVSSTTFGPGENSPAKVNRISGSEAVSMAEPGAKAGAPDDSKPPDGASRQFAPE